MPPSSRSAERSNSASDGEGSTDRFESRAKSLGFRLEAFHAAGWGILVSLAGDSS